MLFLIKMTEVVKTPALQMQTPEASRSVIYSIAPKYTFVNVALKFGLPYTTSY